MVFTIKKEVISLLSRLEYLNGVGKEHCAKIRTGNNIYVEGTACA